MKIISSRKIMPGKARSEAEHAFATAIEFRDAALRASETKIIDGKFQPTYYVPAIVCSAFAVELGIKARIMAGGNLSRVSGHNLNELFFRLPLVDQKWFITNSGYPEKEFFNALQLVSNAFVDWRYVYEKPFRTIDFSFLVKISELATARPTS